MMSIGVIVQLGVRVGDCESDCDCDGVIVAVAVAVAVAERPDPKFIRNNPASRSPLKRFILQIHRMNSLYPVPKGRSPLKLYF